MDSNQQVLDIPARIWTFDGGGPNVISQLIIVHELMYRIQWALKLDSIPRPCDYAEFMVGSGLGAVIVIFLARLRLSAEETLIHISQLGQSVFVEQNEMHHSHQFDVQRLQLSVRNILWQHGHSETSLMIEDAVSTGRPYAAVPLTPTSNLFHCRFIRTYRSPSPEYNCTIMETILAALAQPGWFPPIKIGSAYAKESLVTGAINFSNPTKQALEEAKQVFGPESKASLVLSFGSGRRGHRSLENVIIDKSRNTLDEMAQSGEKAADELFQRFDHCTFYHRFSVDLGMGSVPVTGWNEEDLGAIISHTKVYIERISSSLSVAVELLRKNEGCVTLGQLTQVNIKPATAKSIPHISPFFVERNDIFEFMERLLIRSPGDTPNTQRLFVICGMAGVGKTQSASFFAKRHRDRYQYVFFIDASSVESIKTDLQSAIRSLGGAHSQYTHEEALRFLAHPDNRDWLVIFDNADDPELPLTKLLPKCDHGTLVVTSRNPALQDLAPTAHWHLQGMVQSDSTQVLLKAAKRTYLGSEEETKSATELCSLIGGLPLALVHIGCYCHTTMITFSQYLERFRVHRSKLMAMAPPQQLDQYRYSTYTAIGMSYSLLDENARNLLHVLAFLHPSNILLHILRVASNHEFGSNSPWDILTPGEEHRKALYALRRLLIPDGSWNDFYIDTLLTRLQSFSLISLSNPQGYTIITIHPLVQSCMLDTLSSEAYCLYFYMAVRMISSCSYYEDLSLFQHLPAHISELGNYDMKIFLNESAALAYILYNNGSYHAAMKRWEEMRDECRKVKGEMHRSALQMSHWVALCLYRLYRYWEAEVMIGEVVIAQQQALGGDDEDTLNSYQLMANILREQLKLEQANALYMYIQSSYERTYGSEHWKTLDVQCSLVNSLLMACRDAEAMVIWTRIMPIMKRVCGEDDETIYHTLTVFARVEMDRTRWEEAEAILSEVIPKFMLRYGEHHPYTANVLDSFKRCLKHRFTPEELENVFQERLRNLSRNMRNRVN